MPVVPGPEGKGTGTPTAHDALLQQRIVLVSGILTGDVATTAAAQVMLLDAESDSPIEVHLTSPDGELDAALMLADTIALARVPVTLICRSTIGGPVLGVVAAAPHRVAYPNALFRLQEPELSLSGSAADIVKGAEALRLQLAALHERLAAATGQPIEQVAADMRACRILTADEARQYGLIQEVAAPRHP